MILYQSLLSPFAARVRMAIRAKGIGGIALAPPPGGELKGAAFRALNSMGKIPALRLGDAFCCQRRFNSDPVWRGPPIVI